MGTLSGGREREAHNTIHARKEEGRIITWSNSHGMRLESPGSPWLLSPSCLADVLKSYILRDKKPARADLRGHKSTRAPAGCMARSAKQYQYLRERDNR